MDVDHWSKGCYLDNADGPPPSQTDSTVQMILHKQLETKITLNSQFEQHRHFYDAGELSTLPESSGGLHSVGELQTLEQESAHLTKLSRAGLNQQEIKLFLNATDHPKCRDIFGNYTAEPEAFQKRLEELKSRVVANKQSLTENANPGLSSVESSGTLPEDPFTYIARIAKKYDRSRKRKKQRSFTTSEEVELKDTDSGPPVDPSQWHAVVPLPEQDIITNRLSLQEIQQMPRFANYQSGTTNSTLYLKNLHSKVTLEELIAIFSRYDTADERVRYRLMTGRMKGQAFVYFPNVDAASQALQLTNGYKLRGQPMIVTFAHRKEPERLSSKT